MVRPACLLVASLAFSTAAAQPPAALDADSRAAIDAVFAKWDTTTSPGCAVGVFEKGEIVYARGYGMADLEREVPITSRSVFDIGSVSKQFVAMSILLLEEDGKLTLDDDVRKHVPEMRDYGEPITLRHLLHHTSGIRDYLGLMSLAGMSFEFDYPEQRIVDLIARQKALNFAPGTEHLYSNSGYFLLSEIVRRVSGVTQGAFARERIFGPLGMRDSQFYDDFKRVVKGRAIGYLPGDDGYQTELYLFDLVGDGGVLTTVEDMCKWDANFENNRLGGGEELIRRMLKHGKLKSGKSLPYACALVHGEHRGARHVGHGGAWAGYRAHFVRFADHDVSVAVFSNLGHFNAGKHAMKVAEIVLAGDLEPAPEEAAFESQPFEKEPEPFAPKAEDLEALAGDYYSEELDVTYSLTVREGEFFATVKYEPEWPLKPTAPRQFSLGWVRFRFTGEKERVDGFTVSAGRVRNIGFVRQD